MGRLFAYMANDPDRVRCALYPARELLVLDPRGHEPALDAWGIGLYQDEILLQRRPKPPTAPIDFYALVRHLRTTVLVGHARAGRGGRSKNENTHPFRYRAFLFAHHGEVPGFERIRGELTERVPEFLRRNIRGETDSELLFHLILSQLHAAGRLDDAALAPAALREAVKATVLSIDELAGARGAAAEVKAQECALVITDGHVLVATRRGRPVHLLRMNGIRDCAVCRQELGAGREARPIDHEHLRAICLVANAEGHAGPRWEEIPDNSVVSISSDLGISLDRIA